ncbi:6152_t:CDS:1, partial [Entrophospora sp. SA101]
GPVDRIRDDNNDNGISDDGGDNYLNHLSSPSPIHMNTNDDDRINDDSD